MIISVMMICKLSSSIQSINLLALSHLRRLAAQGPAELFNFLLSAWGMLPECDFPKPCSLDFLLLLFILSSFQSILTLLKASAFTLLFSQSRHPFSRCQMCILPQFPRVLSILYLLSFFFLLLSILFSLPLFSPLLSLHLEIQIQFPAAC